ncbi:MAG: nucleotidyltransferase family protein [Neisseriaceae bacterium]|nr:nucleotidyltransferase family protein [Neisseriaceae bacterium]
MRAMILSAGRGERLRPLTDVCPKPLLSLSNKDTLISRTLRLLSDANVQDVVINLAWLGEKIEQALGDGSEFGVQIHYSKELSGSLETAGGIANALSLLGDEPFIVVNGDILTDIDFNSVSEVAKQLTARQSACLWLVDNPTHNIQGDFGIDSDGYLSLSDKPFYTFSGISAYHPNFFANIAKGEKMPLLPLLREGAKNHNVLARHLNANWLDVGTVERLDKARALIAQGVII